MATVRKRTWTTGRGECRTAWVLSYTDREGRRQRRQFPTKREADAERVRVEGELAQGVHVPDRAAATVLDVARAFLADFEALVEAGKRERSTLRGYRQHVDHHLAPFAIARVKVSRLSGPDCAAYARDLETSRSDDMARRAFATLRTVLKWGIAAGLCTRNPAADVTIRTAGERTRQHELEIPSKAQLRALLQAAADHDGTGEAAAIISTLMFAGLRMSELRGLRRQDLDLKVKRLHVRQRADRWNQIGPCKTRHSRRTVPLPPHTVSALRKWLLKAPNGEAGLVFPNGAGNVESYANLYNRLWTPLMAAAGLAPKGDDSKPRPLFGFHALRHVACSLWIEQGATPKQVQTWAGHASIQFTQDVYGHLWEDAASDQAIVSAAALSILLT